MPAASENKDFASFILTGRCGNMELCALPAWENNELRDHTGLDARNQA